MRAGPAFQLDAILGPPGARAEAQFDARQHARERIRFKPESFFVRVIAYRVVDGDPTQRCDVGFFEEEVRQ